METQAFAAMMEATRTARVAREAMEAAKVAWSACASNAADMVWQATCAARQADNAAAYARSVEAR